MRFPLHNVASVGCWWFTRKSQENRLHVDGGLIRLLFRCPLVAVNVKCVERHAVWRPSCLLRLHLAPSPTLLQLLCGNKTVAYYFTLLQVFDWRWWPGHLAWIQVTTTMRQGHAFVAPLSGRDALLKIMCASAQWPWCPASARFMYFFPLPLCPLLSSPAGHGMLVATWCNWWVNTTVRFYHHYPHPRHYHRVKKNVTTTNLTNLFRTIDFIMKLKSLDPLRWDPVRHPGQDLQTPALCFRRILSLPRPESAILPSPVGCVEEAWVSPVVVFSYSYSYSYFMSLRTWAWRSPKISASRLFTEPQHLQTPLAQLLQSGPFIDNYTL